MAEYTARKLANIQWLQESFAYAKSRNAAAVMLVSQANPGWERVRPHPRAAAQPQNTGADRRCSPMGFVEYLTAVRNEVIAFRRPVAYVHGDSHYFRVDKPLQDSAGSAA